MAAPAPVKCVPTNICLVTARPPDNITAAVVRLEASVVFVNVDNPDAATVVPEKLDAVIVLLLNDSVPAKVAKVPVVGSVTLVAPVVVKPRVCAPVCVKLPPRVIVLTPLLMPVPP